ncbi:hypothetical protein GF359_06800 [candidate division WOR-3 bacterium]|uniref:Uncharacterized protein n=1 Tax=candidate division WOR-3 bacterium TaxID=2052148 RepID=A0A9D5K9K6_UNCW3|nr:hypothetical protein [candidate division WOR-3 bacterium]MBD3364906.1 hypothetical protein [candidate division WOR-3 bacterium]
MGVILSILFLGGFFPQDNLGALAAGIDPSFDVSEKGLTGSVRGLLLAESPYQGYVAFLEPEICIKMKGFSFGIGVLTAPFKTGAVTGLPLTADAATSLNLTENIGIRPRIWLQGPADFYAYSSSNTYDINFSGGGGADIIWSPFSGSLRPVFSLGGTAAYASGQLVDDLADHTEPLMGFGYAGHASISLLLNRDAWAVSLATRASYGGRLIPEISVSFLW